MKTVFFGTPEFAVCTLDALFNSRHEVLAVVSQPDKPKGRGNKLQPTPVKQAALEKNVPVLQPGKVRKREFLTELEKFNADIFVVAAYGQIFPKALLEMPKYGCINVHASLLPKYRGASPISRAIINGDASTGVTIMQMAVDLDTGGMLYSAEIKIEHNDTSGTLHDRLAVLGGKTAVECLGMIEAGTAQRIPQDDCLASYAPMLTKNDGKIDWHKTGSEIANLIRGLNPWPGAYASHNGTVLKFWNAAPLDIGNGGKAAGVIHDISKDGVAVSCGGNSAVLITEIQAPNGKKMPAGEYVKGHSVKAGELFD